MFWYTINVHVGRDNESVIHVQGNAIKLCWMVDDFVMFTHKSCTKLHFGGSHSCIIR